MAAVIHQAAMAAILSLSVAAVCSGRPICLGEVEVAEVVETVQAVEGLNGARWTVQLWQWVTAVNSSVEVVDEVVLVVFAAHLSKTRLSIGRFCRRFQV